MKPAARSLNPAERASSIVRKLVMAFTGLFLSLFLVVHLFGNLQLFLPPPRGQAQFNLYSELLTGSPLIKIASAVTYLGLLVHSLFSCLLAAQNRRARPTENVSHHPGETSSWYSRNMGLLGTVILVFLVIHMKTFWYEYHWGAIGLDAGGRKDLYSVVLFAFRREWYVALYVFSMAAMGYHLLHGFFSAFRTLGLYHRKYAGLVRRAGIVFSIVISAGFASIPLYVYLMQR